MNRPPLSQMFALEEAEEARKSGMTLADELQCAIILRCIPGQLKTHLSDTAKYAENPDVGLYPSKMI